MRQPVEDMSDEDLDAEWERLGLMNEFAIKREDRPFIRRRYRALSDERLRRYFTDTTGTPLTELDGG